MRLWTGGCQCGAVRFRACGELGTASICHCRMCQKAFGSFYAPLVSVAVDALVWTKREPKRFQSSNHVRRGFCEECGTPLTYEAPDGLGVSIGAFDDAAAVVPTVQYGIEGRLRYVDSLAALPALRTEEDIVAAAFLSSLVSRQHPDHPTADEGGGEDASP
ncbi:GFA family protein [Jiella marina]|uniref:GFA family protein n=1 Tax=Jiella sp. LLJ827 TaxID=2917712 RepID=UPI002100A7F4|nr:GFA family protein [Jiella sp. LLJ827]MCQ0987511.1 GFA family protein [Jiella sp. LLJ827]